MKKILFFILLLTPFLFACSSYSPCSHKFLSATCYAPETCTICRVTRGSSLGHSFSEATCTSVAKCSRCGGTQGKTLDHSFLPATCTTPEICSACGFTKGNTIPHEYSETGNCIYCKSDINETKIQDDKTNEKNKDFYMQANGYWGYINDLGTSFEFLVLDNGFFDTGVYEGASDRDGKITKIVKLYNNLYEVNVLREACDDWYGEYIPEENTTYLFQFNSSKDLVLTNKDTNAYSWYTYMGSSMEEAIKYFNNEWKQQNNSQNNNASIGTTKEKSYIKPDTWYKYSSNNVVRAQNAEISSAVSMSKGQVFMINYYSVCSHCSVRSDRLEMTGVGIDTPVSEYYTCNECDKLTYVRFKIEY